MRSSRSLSRQDTPVGRTRILMMKLSDYVVHFVAEQGVKHVFLVTGGGAMHLNASLAQCKAIEPICNSHEQASAMAAENYAKATNHLGVAMVTTGPGGTNAITGLAGAWLDSTPVLFLSGQVKRPDRMFAADGTPLGMRQLGVQEVDIVSIVKPLTKYAVTVLDPATIRYHLEKAVYLALNGRPGPVWIDIPLDVQATPIDETNLPAFDRGCRASRSLRIGCRLAEQVRETIDALNRSERPLIFIGNGVRLARAEDELRKLFALLQIPVEATWCAADIISSEDPLFVGRPGSLASRGANFALQNSDFLLSIGARLDFAITGYAPDRLARAAHKVMVDIDPAEIAKLAPYIHTADLRRRRRFSARDAAPDRVRPSRKTALAGKQRCADWKTRYPVVLDEHRKPEGRVSIFNLAEVIGQETTPDDLMISGNSGSGIEIFLFACPTRTGQRIFHTAGLGAMGCALPNSIGVCLAGGRKTNYLRGWRRRIHVQHSGTGHRSPPQPADQVFHPEQRRICVHSRFAGQLFRLGAARLRRSAPACMIPDLCKVAASFGIATARISSQENLREQVRERARDARPGSVRRARDTRRSSRAAALFHAEARWLAGFETAGRSVALSRSRGVSRQHDHSAAWRNKCLGIMQGRLVPPVEGRIQAFPREQWAEEFPNAAAAGLDAIEWIYDTYGLGANPIETDAGIDSILQLSRAHGIAVRSMCADYFMDFTFVRATDAERTERIAHLAWLLGQATADRRNACRAAICRFSRPFVMTQIGTRSSTRLQRALPAAEAAGIELHLETSLAPGEFATLLGRIPHPLGESELRFRQQLLVGLSSGGRVCRVWGALGQRAYQGPDLQRQHRSAGSRRRRPRRGLRGLRGLQYTGDFILQVARGVAGDEVAWARQNRAYVERSLNVNGPRTARTKSSLWPALPVASGRALPPFFWTRERGWSSPGATLAALAAAKAELSEGRTERVMGVAGDLSQATVVQRGASVGHGTMGCSGFAHLQHRKRNRQERLADRG